MRPSSRRLSRSVRGRSDRVPGVVPSELSPDAIIGRGRIVVGVSGVVPVVGPNGGLLAGGWRIRGSVLLASSRVLPPAC
eukprot:scaffold315064_cov22-Tisochrysis_lutea.AAC.1